MSRSVFYAAYGAWQKADGIAKHDAWLVLRALEDATRACDRCHDTGTTPSGYGPLGWHDGEPCDCDLDYRVTDEDMADRIEVTPEGHVRNKRTGGVCLSGEPAVKLINSIRAEVLSKAAA